MSGVAHLQAVTALLPHHLSLLTRFRSVLVLEEEDAMAQEDMLVVAVVQLLTIEFPKRSRFRSLLSRCPSNQFIGGQEWSTLRRLHKYQVQAAQL
jgi:hypothetical protein